MTIIEYMEFSQLIEAMRVIADKISFVTFRSLVFDCTVERFRAFHSAIATIAAVQSITTMHMAIHTIRGLPYRGGGLVFRAVGITYPTILVFVYFDTAVAVEASIIDVAS